MSINKDSNIFTFSFAIIMVLIVAISLAVVSESLSSMKKENKEDKKKINILSAIKVECDRSNASELYKKYIKKSIVINSSGEIIEDDNIDAIKNPPTKAENIILQEPKPVINKMAAPIKTAITDVSPIEPGINPRNELSKL